MAGPKKKSGIPGFLYVCVVVVFLCVGFLSGGDNVQKATGSLFHLRGFQTKAQEESLSFVKEDTVDIEIEVKDEGDVVFNSSEGYYRYGPSIIEYEDGSYDVWFSSPGNNSTQWDYIRYRHSDDGIHWTKDKVVLTPSPDSKDQCSVCDPGVIYFDGYYYLAYTSTSDYQRKGTNNQGFVARSKNPDGPFEKWNGSGWGGKPMPILSYEGDPAGWGIGELSFVLMEKDLYIYYTYFDLNGGSTCLAKAKTGENWPSEIENIGVAITRSTQDSADVFYADDLKLFLAFAIKDKMAESSSLAVYVSSNGREFKEADFSKQYIENYAHNLGIAKSPEGHQSTDKEILFGYAYGRRWARWNTKFHHLMIHSKPVYKLAGNE